MSLLAGPLLAASIVIAVVGDQGDWGLAALAGLAALVLHADRLMGLVSSKLDVAVRRRASAALPVAVALAIGCVIGAGELVPSWSALARLLSAATGLACGLFTIAAGTRGFFPWPGSKQRRVAFSWIAEDDPFPAAISLAGIALALSLEDGVTLLAGAGATASIYLIGVRAMLRRRLVSRLTREVESGETGVVVPDGWSPVAWRWLRRSGDEIVEIPVAAPSARRGEETRRRAADAPGAPADVARAVTWIARVDPTKYLVAVRRAGGKDDVMELVQLEHGRVDRAGPGRIRVKLGGKAAVAAVSD